MQYAIAMALSICIIVMIFWQEKLSSYENYDSLKQHIDGCLLVISDLNEWVNNSLPEGMKLSENSKTHCKVIADEYRFAMLRWYFKTNSWDVGKMENANLEENIWIRYREFLDFLINRAGICGSFGQFDQYRVTLDCSRNLSDFGIDLYKVIYATSKVASEFGMPEGYNEKSDKWLSVIKAGEI